jgi:hypothetical protein
MEIRALGGRERGPGKLGQFAPNYLVECLYPLENDYGTTMGHSTIKR